jgi:type IV pilus assembly protein PilV
MNTLHRPSHSNAPGFQARRVRPLHAPRAGRRSRSAGVSLVEVLVAILLFSFGLLGLVGLQARATQYAISAEDSNRAALLASDLAATMWTAGTTSLPQATVDAWSERVSAAAAGGLPNGQGTVDVAGGVATITVSWRPPHVPSTQQHRYQTQVVLP